MDRGGTGRTRDRVSRNYAYHSDIGRRSLPDFAYFDSQLLIWSYPSSKGEDDVNDPNFVMDCDFEENLKEKTQREIVESTRRGSRRRKSRFAQALERKKPSFDPEKGRVDHSIYGWHH